MVQQRIVVMGATGRTGMATLQQLRQHPGIALRAVQHQGGRALPPMVDVDVVQADYMSSESMRRALHAAHRVFWVTPAGLDQARYTEVMVDAARLCGVQHIVHMGTMGCEQEPCTVLDTQCTQSEALIAAATCTHTFLRACCFAQNFTEPQAHARHSDGAFVHWGEGRAAWVDCRDIGAVAAAALTSNDHYQKTYTLTGPQAYSCDEVAELMAEVLGHPVTFRRLPPTPLSIGDELHAARLGRAYKLAQGMFAAPSDDIARILGRPPQDLRDFFQEHQALLK